MWTFKEAQEYLNDTAPQGKSVYGLGRINHLLDILEHPEKKFLCVTIVGTNGKGSVLAFLDSLLRAHGIRTACHIKPHLESVTERIRIDGIDSTEDEFASALWEVRGAVDNSWTRDDRPTYFELVFAAFLCAARTVRIDIALLETGLGGRLDAVNSVDAPLVLLTSVSLDHTDLLGDSLESITAEKLAVVRPGSILVCQVNPPEVMTVARSFASEQGFRLIEADENTGLSESPDGSFVCSSRALGRIENIKLGLRGPFQKMNASLSLPALDILAADVAPGLFPNGIQPESLKQGLEFARLPGRWETFRLQDSGSRLILDGAHNPQALTEVLSRFADETGGKGAVIFGIKKGKNVEDVIPALLEAASCIIFVEIPDLECHDPEELAELAHRRLDNKERFSQIHIGRADSIPEALERAAKETGEGGAILVTGSLYLVGAVRSMLGEKTSIRERSHVV